MEVAWDVCNFRETCSPLTAARGRANVKVVYATPRLVLWKSSNEFPRLKKMDLHASVGEVMQVLLMTDLLNIPLCPSALIGGMWYKIMTFRHSVTHRGVEISSNIPIIKLKGLVVLLWISCLSTLRVVRV